MVLSCVYSQTQYLPCWKKGKETLYVTIIHADDNKILLHCSVGHLLCLAVLAHFYAIEWKFIAYFLLQITPSEHILEVAFTFEAIKSFFTVDGLGKVFCASMRCELLLLLSSRCECTNEGLRSWLMEMVTGQFAWTLRAIFLNCSSSKELLLTSSCMCIILLKSPVMLQREKIFHEICEGETVIEGEKFNPFEAFVAFCNFRVIYGKLWNSA